MKDWAAFALTVSATLLIGHFLFGALTAHSDRF